MSCFMPPSCSFCKHYLGDQRTRERECLAFKEIPDEIITGASDHTEPFPGDNNILFALNKELQSDFEEVQRIKKELFLFES